MRERCYGDNLENMHNVTEKQQAVPLFDAESLQNHENVFRFLNEKDKDILYLIFISNKKQKSVKTIMKRTQPSLVYDVKRIRERIQFIVYLSQVFDIFVDFVEYHSYINNHNLEIEKLTILINEMKDEISKLESKQKRSRKKTLIVSIKNDIKKIKQRLYRVMKKIDSLLSEKIEDVVYDKTMLDIMILMYYTTSLTLTAKILNMQQIKVRYVFQTILKKLRVNKDWEIYEIFSTINRNKNKVKRTYKGCEN